MEATREPGHDSRAYLRPKVGEGEVDVVVKERQTRRLKEPRAFERERERERGGSGDANSSRRSFNEAHYRDESRRYPVPQVARRAK